MRKVLLLERSEAGVWVRAGEGVEVTVGLEWFGESSMEGAIECAIGVVVFCEQQMGYHQSPKRAGCAFVPERAIV
jgi:hypothetical protein